MEEFYTTLLINMVSPTFPAICLGKSWNLCLDSDYLHNQDVHDVCLESTPSSLWQPWFGEAGPWWRGDLAGAEGSALLTLRQSRASSQQETHVLIPNLLQTVQNFQIVQQSRLAMLGFLMLKYHFVKWVLEYLISREEWKSGKGRSLWSAC